MSITTKLFIALLAGNKEKMSYLLSKHPEFINDTIPHDIIPKMWGWLSEEFYSEDQPCYIKEAIDIYSKTTMLNLCFQLGLPNALDIFLMLLEKGCKVEADDYLRAIGKANFHYSNDDLPNSAWLHALLKQEKGLVPFGAMEYSLANDIMTAFDILCTYNKNLIHSTTTKIYHNKSYTVGLLGKARTINQVKLLFEKGTNIYPGDIFYRLTDICMDPHILEYLIKVFVEKYFNRKEILDIFDINNGQFVINENMIKSINIISFYNESEEYPWIQNIHECIQNAVGRHIIPLQILCLNVFKKKATIEELEIITHIFI